MFDSLIDNHFLKVKSLIDFVFHLFLEGMTGGAKATNEGRDLERPRKVSQERPRLDKSHSTPTYDHAHSEQFDER